MKSRKTIVLIFAILVAALGFIKTDFQLVGNPAEAVGALGVALIYVFSQAKVDLKGFKDNAGKLKDYKFWIAMIGVVIAPINETLGISLPVEMIQGFAAVILPVIFGWIWKKTPATPVP